MALGRDGMLKEEQAGRDGSRLAALLRVILTSRARWEAMHSGGKDHQTDMIALWERCGPAQFGIGSSPPSVSGGYRDGTRSNCLR